MILSSGFGGLFTALSAVIYGFVSLDVSSADSKSSSKSNNYRYER